MRHPKEGACALLLPAASLLQLVDPESENHVLGFQAPELMIYMYDEQLVLKVNI